MTTDSTVVSGVHSLTELLDALGLAPGRPIRPHSPP